MGTDRAKIPTNNQQILTPQPLFPATNRSRIRINWPIFVDELVAELMGMIIHTGKVSKNESFIIIRGTSRYPLMEERLNFLLNQLNLSLNVNSQHWSGMFTSPSPVIYSAQFVATLLSMWDTDRITQLVGVEHIPTCITQSPLPIQQSFFVGYVSTCHTKIWNDQLLILPYLSTFVKDLSKILTLLNIKHTIKPDYLITDLGIDIKAEFEKVQNKGLT